MSIDDTRRGGGPDQDFEVDLSVIDFTAEHRLAIERHLADIRQAQVVLSERDWTELRLALATFLAQERYREVMPNKGKLAQLAKIRDAARRLREQLTRFTEDEVEWLLSRELPEDERESLDRTLVRLANMEKRAVEYPPAAPLLDAKLRAIWTRLTDGATISFDHSGERRSAYDYFLALVYQALPADAKIAETSKASSQRPQQLEEQRRTHEIERSEFAEQIKTLANKLQALRKTDGKS